MRQEKQLLLDEIKEQIERYGSFVILRYSGLKPNDAHNFRSEVANSGGDVEMVRKRLLVRAAEAAGIEVDVNLLDGHIGLVFTGEDPVQTTKVVYQFKKDTNDALDVIGGRFDGQLYGAADVEKLSKLPSKDEMRAQLLSVLEAPMSQSVAVLDAVMTSIPYCIDNKVKQQEGASE